MLKRVVITDYPKYTGIGKYVFDLLQLQETETTVFSLGFKRDMDVSRFFGKLFIGKLVFPFTSGWILNNWFQKSAFRELQGVLSKLERDANFLFHYSDYGIRRYTGLDSTVLTIHDFFSCV